MSSNLPSREFFSNDYREENSLIKSVLQHAVKQYPCCHSKTFQEMIKSPLKRHYSVLVLYFHIFVKLTKDTFKKEWSKSKQQRPRYPN